MPNLITLCEAIKENEGFMPPGQNSKYPNGTASWRNNNPGNCRFNPGGYRAIYGEVKRSEQGFAVFKDYETGWLYLQNLVRSKIQAHPTWTIFDFFKNYAPVEDGNDPIRYAAFVSQKMGVGSDFIIGNLIA